jgi:hypothetical protein
VSVVDLYVDVWVGILEQPVNVSIVLK